MSEVRVATVPPGGPFAGLADTAALAGRHLLHLRRAPGKFLGIVMNPLILLIAVGYLFRNSISVPGSGNYQEYLMAGVAVQVGLASIGPTAIGVAMDMRGGLVDRFRSLPVSRTAVLVGQTLSDLIVSALGLVIVMLVGLAVGWRPHAGPLSVAAGFALILAFIYTMLWVGVLLGLLLRSPETIDSVGAIVLVAFSFLSNAFFSVAGLPSWIRPLAEWNPVSAVVTACRTLWGNPVVTGTGFPADHPVLVTAGTLAVLLAVCVPLSLRAYRKA
ncbi:ABC transporter permease [Streptomyces sp. NPDC018019]|uniref:ABC transporter permease n=1 Tax=Streptomyces sp. NPDC018019 TaxID=3365030 RepID=UPI0037909115